MEFMFIGNPDDPRDNRGEVSFYGIRFPLNVAVKVSEPAQIKKLMGNNHFVIVDGGKAVHPVKKLIIPDAPAIVVSGEVAKPRRGRKSADATA